MEIKVEFLLPFKDHSGKPFSGDKYDLTNKELDKQFGGYSIDFTPLLGSWRDDDGVRYIDNNFGIWVACKNTNQNRKFWKNYQKILKKRFEQKSIMMYYTRIYFFK